jgi:hypothetical protein
MATRLPSKAAFRATGRRAAILRGATLTFAATLALASRDSRMARRGESDPDITASIAGSRGRGCQGERAPSSTTLPRVLYYELRAGAFPGSARPDVAVHVPPGFDPRRRPGVVVYFHGWRGCVASALAHEDAPCAEGGPPRAASDLATSVDAAGVNALLVAIELRADMPTGEPGRLAMPGGLRDLLRELLGTSLVPALGCALDIDGLDRIVLVAHSGGYQAAASALALGDVPRITEVDLLDALYGADAIFFRWFESEIARFDPLTSDSLRFVDLYTCCGGTADRSRALARRMGDALSGAGLSRALSDSSVAGSAVVFKEVTRAHEELPGAYLRELVAAAGFAPIARAVDPPSAAHIAADESHSLRLN